MTDKSVFISTCSRRELARRRAGRAVWRANLRVALLAATVAGLTVLALHGGF